MAKKITRTIGLEKLLKQLNATPNLAITASKSALFEEATEIMAESKKLVPTVTSALKNSGFVELPAIAATKIVIEMGYGGPAAPYALAVHENPRAGKTGGVSPSGKPYPPKRYSQSGEYKYLEKPFRAASAGMAKRLLNRIDALLRRKL